MHKIIYLTYQTFPSDSANTLQTIDNTKYIKRKGYEVEIIFPLRSKTSTDDINVIKTHYGFKEDLKFKGIVHNLPFGKIKIFEKYLYLFSHITWSKKITKEYKKNAYEKTIFFTRSDWIFYFLSKKELNVTFECHQLTRLRKWIINYAIKKENSKIIFLNDNLKLDSDIDSKYSKKILVLQNGVDSDLFHHGEQIHNNKVDIIFTGNMKRFNEDRGIKFLIDSFLNPKFPNNLKLKIIGWPFNEVEKFKNYVEKIKLNNRIEIKNKLDRKSTIETIQNSNIGLLINSSRDLHSVNYTSPLKYFEYLYGELNIVAIDFPSHRSLPYSKNISFFKENDQEGLINALSESLNKKVIPKEQLSDITLKNRVDKLLSFIEI
tara:strand:- start:10 stop:1137 length:1128 start_codon:yes stop_codon:yes gene_type:complete